MFLSWQLYKISKPLRLVEWTCEDLIKKLLKRSGQSNVMETLDRQPLKRLLLESSLALLSR